MRCLNKSTAYVGGNYGAGWCVCAEHVMQTVAMYPSTPTVRALEPNEPMLLTTVGIQERRAQCQWDDERDRGRAMPTQLFAPAQPPAPEPPPPPKTYRVDDDGWLRECINDLAAGRCPTITLNSHDVWDSINAVKDKAGVVTGLLGRLGGPNVTDPIAVLASLGAAGGIMGSVAVVMTFAHAHGFDWDVTRENAGLGILIVFRKVTP
jgi:hypothetical protein